MSEIKNYTNRMEYSSWRKNGCRLLLKVEQQRREKKAKKKKTINDLKEFDERKWWHFWTWGNV